MYNVTRRAGESNEEYVQRVNWMAENDPKIKGQAELMELRIKQKERNALRTFRDKIELLQVEAKYLQATVGIEQKRERSIVESLRFVMDAIDDR